MPQFCQRDDDSKNTVYVDVAGLQDSRGDLIELVNIFINKELFRRSNSVRFLLPIPHGQINDARGQATREQIRVIQQICEADLDQMIDAILPVITRVDVKDEDFDLEDVQEILLSQFEEEIQRISKENVKASGNHSDFLDDDEELPEQADDTQNRNLYIQ